MKVILGGRRKENRGRGSSGKIVVIGAISRTSSNHRASRYKYY